MKNARSKGPGLAVLNARVHFELFTLERYLLGNASSSVRCEENNYVDGKMIPLLDMMDC